jgi:phosphoribosylaminoimidazole carboxylase (NCAIR synthetase)
LPTAICITTARRSRQGRKVGHANLRCADMATLNAQIQRVEALIDEQ